MGAVGGPGVTPQVQDAPTAIDRMPKRPMNQVNGFSRTTTRKNGYVSAEAVTPVTEVGKVQSTATAPPGVLEPHPEAAVVAV